MSTRETRYYQFGPFVLNPDERVLLRDGLSVLDTGKPLELLLVLVTNYGHIVEKETLISKVWPNTFVEDSSLTQHISVLRKILGETPEDRFIETIQRRGYRFIKPVEWVEERLDVIEEPPRVDDFVIDPDNKDQQLRPAGPAPLKVPEPSPLPVPRPAPYRRRSRFLVVSAATVVVLLVAYGLKTRLWPGRIRGVAVLPFRVLRADENDKYLARGITNELTRQLGGLEGITISPPGAVSKYDREDQDWRSAGEELGVQAVVTGTILRSQDTVRVSVELNGIDDRRQLWTNNFDDRSKDILTTQDSMAGQIAQALKSKLVTVEKDVQPARYTRNQKAYENYVIGRAFLGQRTQVDIEKARDYFIKAAEADQSYALAYAGLADSYALLGSTGYDLNPDQTLSKAKQAALEALRLDLNLAEAHTSLGVALLFYDWNLPEAKKELERALELNSKDETTRYWYVVCLIADGRTQEAILKSRGFEAGAPDSESTKAAVARALYYGRQYDESIRQCQKILDANPTYVPAHIILASSYEQNQNPAGAVREFEYVRDQVNGVAVSLGLLGAAYAQAGQQGEAKSIIDALDKRSKQNYISPSYYAAIYAALGDKDKAFDFLDKAVKEKASSMVFLKVEPTLDPLRGDRRFDELVKRIRPVW